MNILVLGGNGYLGQNLISWLIDHHFNIHCVDMADNFSNDSVKRSHKFAYEKLDLSRLENIKKIKFETFDLIYILAGKTGTKSGFQDYQSFVELNELLLLNILSVYKQRKASARIIFPSSRLVYKGRKDTFLDEKSEKEAKSIYAANKLACEFFLESWSNAYGIPFTVFRICVPYGHLIPRSYSYGTLGFMISQAKETGEIIIYGDGSQKRTFTHVADICEVLGKASCIKSTKNKIINIGSHDNFEILKLANLISYKYNAKVVQKEWPKLDLLIESGDTMFDDSLLQSLYPYNYKKNIQEFVNL